MKGGSKWTTGWRTSLANSHTMRTTAERPWLRREGYSLSKTALHVDQKSRRFELLQPQLCQLRPSVFFILWALRLLNVWEWFHGFWNYSLMVSCLHINEKVWSCVLIYLRTIGTEWRSLQAMEKQPSKQPPRPTTRCLYMVFCALRRSRSWSYFVSLSSYGLCWFASCCVPRHIRAFAWGDSVAGTLKHQFLQAAKQHQKQTSHRIGGSTPFHLIFWALGYSRQPAMLVV